MSEIINRIVQFKNSPTTQQLKEYYATSSLMEIYGINRKEIRHTSFLKWLFEKEAAISESALRKLLDIIILNTDSLGEELQQLLLIGNYEIEHNSVKENHSIRQGSIDLYIDLTIRQNDKYFPIEIIIENKVYSKEHDDQTQKYYDYFTKVNLDAKKVFLYLTPISSLELDELEEPQCICKNFVQINYQLIIDKIIEPLLKEDINQNIEFILLDYLKALSAPAMKHNNDKHMAISSKENELLTRFWEENEDLILKAVNATKENSNIEPQKREVATRISELLNNKEERVGAYVKRNLIELFRQNKITDQEIIDFQDKRYSKEIFHIQYPLLTKVITPLEKPKHYWKDIVSANNENYYICCEWYETEVNNDKLYFDQWLKTKLN